MLATTQEVDRRPAIMLAHPRAGAIPRYAEDDSRLGDSNVVELKMVASGIFDPAPEAFIARPENRRLRKQIIDLALNTPDREDALQVRECARILALGRIHGKGKQRRARVLAVRVEALFRLKKILGSEEVGRLIV